MTTKTIRCIVCCVTKPSSEFKSRQGEKFQNRGVSGTRSSGHRTTCGSCKKDGQRERYARYKQDSYFKYKATRARSRSQSLRVPFNLTPEYLESIWTGSCPVTGLPLDKQAVRNDEQSAELDRFEPELGYVEGNVAFLSRKINRLKNNASIEELEQLLNWMKSVKRRTENN